MTDILTKKEKGKLRYEKRRARVAARRARDRATRPSDTRKVPRIGEGMAANHQPQVFTAPTPPKRFTHSPLSLFLQAVQQASPKEPKNGA